MPVDIVIIVVLALLALAVVYLVANANSKGNRGGKGAAIATWAAVSALVFFVGGGLLMFGVLVVFLVAGDSVARVVLPIVALVIVASPVLVAIGGITLERAPAVLEAGASVVAIAGALFRQADPAAEFRRWKLALG